MCKMARHVYTYVYDQTMRDDSIKTKLPGQFRFYFAKLLLIRYPFISVN